jgi:hypothetical protein
MIRPKRSCRKVQNHATDIEKETDELGSLLLGLENAVQYVRSYLGTAVV